MMTTPQLGLVSYLSLSKLQQLSALISEIDEARISTETGVEVQGRAGAGFAGFLGFLSANAEGNLGRRKVKTLEGSLNPYSQLHRVLRYLSDTGSVLDLEDWSRGTAPDRNLVCCRTSFRVAGDAEPDSQPDEETKTFYGNNPARSRICILRGEANGFQISLSCSLKYFGDMGMELRTDSSGGRVAEIVPHSGNYFFFDGKMPCAFDAYFFVSHVAPGAIYGSPLVMIQAETLARMQPDG
jgi:hypothetical protein